MMIRIAMRILVVGCLLGTMGEARADEDADTWLKRFSFEPLVAQEDLPKIQPLVTWSRRIILSPPEAGTHTVRVSLALPQGVLLCSPKTVAIHKVNEKGTLVQVDVEPDVRVVSYWNNKHIHRALISFPYTFQSMQPIQLVLSDQNDSPGEFILKAPAQSPPFEWHIGTWGIRLEATEIVLLKDEQKVYTATFTAPAITSDTPPKVELIEGGQHYLWARILIPDAQWPRILEVRADALGTVAFRGHLQKHNQEEGFAPAFGWNVEGVNGVAAMEHAFSSKEALTLEGDTLQVYFPDAHLKRKGVVTAKESSITYLRATGDDEIPHQGEAWRTATVVVAPKDRPQWNELLEAPLTYRIAAEDFDALYASGKPTDLAAHPSLKALRDYHNDAIATSTLLGDDFGNVCGMPTSGTYGMNRLNHCPPIFEEYYRTGDARLRDVALNWCSNFYDLTIWWGNNANNDFGGTRYNNVSAYKDIHKGDQNFMWRDHRGVTFCTKGYDSFLYAYEETGDPRYAVALKHQVEYAKKHVHTNDGECRNIGDVVDFIRLYNFTGDEQYRVEGLRLFRELKEKLNPDHLFAQGGKQFEENPPFIDNDAAGYGHPYRKPYIMGYALQGLPALAVHEPDEERLPEVIHAVAQFMAASQDPTGGWRYPDPSSSWTILGQSIEHANQIMRAARWMEARGEDIEPLLDAIERTLQLRLHGYLITGQFMAGLGAWEHAAGILEEGQTIQDLYGYASERDKSRDYSEGAVSAGGAPPDGVVYFSQVLDFYLEHRDAGRLFGATPEMRQSLERLTPVDAAPGDARAEYRDHGMARRLPTFNAKAKARLTYPLSYTEATFPSFAAWREAARAKFLECLLSPPPEAPFAPVVIGREQRDGYEARKILFNVSADCRIPAYLLVPDGDGPFPAILTLHDHGAHFSIGKEKVVKPFGVDDAVLADAQEWVDKYYGQRWIGDALAKDGYVVLAIDALYWGERGRKEGRDYEYQQQLSANLLQVGMTWPGVVTWDDMRSADYVASLPYVDASRIGAVGLSMGSHRTWMLSAATDRIAAGAAICWMGTTDVLMRPGNNQTTGASAYSMLVPNLRNFMDYPDVASIACPKAMLFFNGTEDGLFPVEGVEDAYAKMHTVWKNQGAEDKLKTKLFPVPHLFNREMQDEAFAFLAAQLKE